MLGGIDYLPIFKRLRGLCGNGGAALIGFIQGGLGALAGTVQGQLRKSCFLSDYATAGNFATAAAALSDTAAFCKLSVVGNAEGSLAISGDYYNHAVCTLGFNSSPLNQTHQVGFLSLLQANSSAAGAGSFHAAFEGQCGTLPGAYTLAELTVFQTGSVTKGAGTTITRTRNLSVYEETAGTHNACISLSTSAFTGNWFIHYDGVLPSNIARFIISPGEIYKDSTNGYVRISGGGSAADGASVIVFGSTHANANQMQLNAAGGATVNLGGLTVTHATGGLGYGTGAGGTVAQATNKATTVVLNKSTGEITMNGAALNADTTVSFTLTNSAIALGDHVLVQHVSAGTLGSYFATATAAAGSATIYVRNVTPGNLSEAIVLKFSVLKAATA